MVLKGKKKAHLIYQEKKFDSAGYACVFWLALRAGIKCKRLYERLELNMKVKPLSNSTLNASRSYNILYFIYALKASQLHVRNRRKCYATLEIHLESE